MFSEILPMLLRAMMPIISFKITRIINVPQIIFNCGILLCQQTEKPNIAASQPFHLRMVNTIFNSTNFSQDIIHLLVCLLRLSCFLRSLRSECTADVLCGLLKNFRYFVVATRSSVPLTFVSCFIPYQ